jgi:two-component system sensor histidine kinase HydH
MNRPTRNTWQFLFIAALIISITLMHYLTHLDKAFQHIFFRELYIIPIILAGFWFGFKGGLSAALLVTALYLPFVLLPLSEFSAQTFGSLMEILLFNLVGGALGWLRDRDISHQKQMRQVESLAAMGRAVSSIAHDIKSPLVAVGGLTRQVHRRMATDDPARSKLEVVMKQTARLEMLVKDMLAFARPLHLEKKPEDINEVAAEVLTVAAENARQRDILLQSRLAADLPRFAVDRHRLQQALLNLLVNAVEASPAGESVVLLTAARNNRVIIEIVDKGPGVPAAMAEEICKPFVSTKKEGTGLGLSIVKKVVEAHHGVFSFQTNGGQGMTFRISLPIIF